MKESTWKITIPALLLLSVSGGMVCQLLEKLKLVEDLFQWLLLATVLAGCALVVYWHRKGVMTTEKWLLLLFLAAFAARLCYISSISIRVNQHDVRYFNYPKANYGHTGYIEYLLENGHLPDFDVRGKFQFYHPPLHHILCALWLKLQTAVGIAFSTAAENLQILTLFYSMTALYAAGRIFRLIGLKGKALICSFALVAFHPTFFLLSGSINNDCLSVCLGFCAVWAALEWHRSHGWGSIVALALCIGGSMAAKLTAGLIAPAVALLFLYDLIKERGAGAKWRLIGQFAAFGAICVPLGIGWEVRNYLRFGVPITYVPLLGSNIDQYLGGYSVPERLFDFGSLFDFGVFPSRTGTQGALYFDHCIPLTALKTSLFGEYSVWRDSTFFRVLGDVLFAVNGVAVLTGLAGMVGCGIDLVKSFRPGNAGAFFEKRHTGRAPVCLLLVYWGTMIVSYVLFCFSYPHFCSMDFRYIVPTLLVGACFFGKAMERLEETRGKRTSAASKAKAASAASALLTATTVVFSVCSVCMYPFFYK